MCSDRLDPLLVKRNEEQGGFPPLCFWALNICLEKNNDLCFNSSQVTDYPNLGYHFLSVLWLWFSLFSCIDFLKIVFFFDYPEYTGRVKGSPDNREIIWPF